MDMRLKLLPEPLDVESDLVGVAFEVGSLERLLAPKEQVVHRPKPLLRVRRLARLRRRQGVWMNLDERKVPEDESERDFLSLQVLNAAIGGTRIGALVITEDDERRSAPAAQVVAPVRDLRDQSGSQKPTTSRTITT